MIKIAELNADSIVSMKEIVDALDKAGFKIVYQEGYDDSVYICKDTFSIIDKKFASVNFSKC